MLCEKLLLSLGLIASIAASPLAAGHDSKPNSKVPAPALADKLRFTKDGKFQVSVFEDFHYGENEDGGGKAQDAQSEAVINTVLSYENPQLAVLNGDLIHGDDTFVENSTNYMDEIVRPLVQHKLQWAALYGNHDRQHNITGRTIFEREKTYPNSLTQDMLGNDSYGVTNYYLDVYGADKKNKRTWWGKTEPEKPVLRLWFFDSRGGSEYQKRDAAGKLISIPQWVHENVASWFLQTNAALVKKEKTVIPSIAFVHYPVNAEGQMQVAGVDKNKFPGIADDIPLDHQGTVKGVYVGGDIPFMSALLKTNGLLALFSGHQHGTDWCGKWDGKLPDMDLVGNGMNLCFGRHTGYGGYGEWVRGARQILIDEKILKKEKSFKTWNRLETGEISGSVNLNATYGEDLYPAVLTKYSQ